MLLRRVRPSRDRLAVGLARTRARRCGPHGPCRGSSPEPRTPADSGGRCRGAHGGRPYDAGSCRGRVGAATRGRGRRGRGSAGGGTRTPASEIAAVEQHRAPTTATTTRPVRTHSRATPLPRITVTVITRAIFPSSQYPPLTDLLLLDHLPLAAAPPPAHPHHAWAALPFLSA